MASEIDSSIGIALETTYGTGVTVTKFPEFLSETFEWKPTFIQSAGFRPGSRVARNERRALGKNYAEGDLELECVTKGLGVFFNALLGSVTNTLVSGTAWQQVHTLGADPLNSYTIQKGIPLLGGGAVQPHTFTGSVCTKGEIKAATGDTVKLKTSWNAQAVNTATAYAAPSYVANNEVFNFTQGAITLGGAVTMPTSNTLATGGTVVNNVLDFSLAIDNKLDVNGYVFGNGGKQGRKPVLGGLTDFKGKITAEFDSVTLRDAFLNQTALALVLTFTSTTVISAGVSPVLQIVLPAIKLNGDIPNATMGVVKQTIDFDVLDNGTNPPIYVVIRTADTTV
jgi:hypothetical protein